MADLNDYKSDAEVQWCPGCPNHLILRAVKNALVELDLSPWEVCLVSGIGQAAKLPHYLKCNYFNGLHGRALPAALGIIAANTGLKVFVTTGEGDCYGEGGNHFLHLLRRNPDLTLIVHDNSFYALTKGQASPTTPLGEIRSLQPHGVSIPPLNALGIAIIQGCGFVAQGFAGEEAGLRALIVKGANHRGLSLINVIQPCISWGRHPMEWYRARVKPIPESHDPGDRAAALNLAEAGEGFPVGVLYRKAPASTFGEEYRARISDKPLTQHLPLQKEVIERVMSPLKRGG